MKVFVNDVLSLDSSVVGCGGVIHDLEMNVLEVFMYSFYGYSNVKTELWGGLWGLMQA